MILYNNTPVYNVYNHESIHKGNLSKMIRHCDQTLSSYSYFICHWTKFYSEYFTCQISHEVANKIKLEKNPYCEIIISMFPFEPHSIFEKKYTISIINTVNIISNIRSI